MPRIPLAIAFFGLLGLAAACPKPSTDGGGQNPDGSNATVPGGAVDPGATNPDASASTAEGCLSDADCDGGVCEGQGCGDDEPGTCAPQGRMCTRDSVAYCGCDGNTFRSSGSCPGQRYASKGECGGEDPSTAAPERSPCLANSDCPSGICEGEGCGDDKPGTCAPKNQMCTRDLQAYCGCDGTTFRASGSCPGQRYAARGECGPKSGA